MSICPFDGGYPPQTQAPTSMTRLVWIRDGEPLPVGWIRVVAWEDRPYGSGTAMARWTCVEAPAVSQHD